jgi:hypothetical protein
MLFLDLISDFVIKFVINQFEIFNRYDVVGGALLGVFFAICTCHILSQKLDGSKTNVEITTNNNQQQQQQRLLSTIIATKEEFSMNNLE